MVFRGQKRKIAKDRGFFRVRKGWGENWHLANRVK